MKRRPKRGPEPGEIAGTRSHHIRNGMLKGAWIPNTLTLGNLACGFVSIVYASLGTWEGKVVAAVLILLAAFLDGLDGQVARRLGVEGPMGKELDSLADCVTFGVPPPTSPI